MDELHRQYGINCWWCGKPADDDATITVTMQKKEFLSRTTRTERYRVHQEKISIYRCNQCKEYQTDNFTFILSSAMIFIVGGACYLGYYIQGRSGWVMYVFGIVTFVILMGLMVARNIRRDKRMPEEFHLANAKTYDEHPRIVALKEDGYSKA